MARAVKGALEAVVERGTARGLRGAFARGNGARLAVGGKTGTGDNRYVVRNARGGLVRSRVVNRTAAFVFFIGPRWFGVVTAYLPGGRAGRHRFTSALATQVLKGLARNIVRAVQAASTAVAEPRPAAPRRLGPLLGRGARADGKATSGRP